MSCDVEVRVLSPVPFQVGLPEAEKSVRGIDFRCGMPRQGLVLSSRASAGQAGPWNVSAGDAGPGEIAALAGFICHTKGTTALSPDKPRCIGEGTVT